MDTLANIAEVDCTKETARQRTLLDLARSRIDRLARLGQTGDGLDDLLDFMAYFTREYFGFQERILAESANHPEYLAERLATHAEFRSRLAHICADAPADNSDVIKRLSALCYELWLDLSMQQDQLTAIVRGSNTHVRLREKARMENPALKAILRFDD